MRVQALASFSTALDLNPGSREVALRVRDVKKIVTQKKKVGWGAGTAGVTERCKGAVCGWVGGGAECRLSDSGSLRCAGGASPGPCLAAGPCSKQV